MRVLRVAEQAPRLTDEPTADQLACDPERGTATDRGGDAVPPQEQAAPAPKSPNVGAQTTT